jgi:hypothetical protein
MVSREDVQLAIRIPRELMKAIDAEVKKRSAEQPALKINKSDVVRQILYDALIRR